jgi:hypothetical protein
MDTQAGVPALGLGNERGEGRWVKLHRLDNTSNTITLARLVVTIDICELKSDFPGLLNFLA